MGPPQTTVGWEFRERSEQDVGERATMRHVEAGLPVDDSVGRFAVAGSLGGPGSDLAAAVESLVDGFVDGWIDGGRLDYHGARTTSPVHGTGGGPLSGHTRQRIAATARSLYRETIAYTFADQLDYVWWDWDGTPGDVDEIRCDGIIEYSYEKQGVRVCSGDDASEWNVTKPGIRYPENHNDFHNNRWNEGELCPKVQAGDEGSDSDLTRAPPDPPTVETFDWDISPKWPPLSGRPGRYPRFSVRVDSATSRQVFVRVAVAPAGGDLHYLTGDSGSGWTPTWRYRPTPSGRTVTLEWRGATSGPDFEGDDGEYVARAVAVDRGGNVSPEIERTVDVYWP